MKRLLVLSIILTLLYSGCATIGGVTSDYRLIFNGLITTQEDKHGVIYEIVTNNKPKYKYDFLSTKRYAVSLLVRDGLFVEMLKPSFHNPEVQSVFNGIIRVNIVDPQTNIMISFYTNAKQYCDKGECWIGNISYNYFPCKFFIIQEGILRKAIKFTVENANSGEKNKSFMKKMAENIPYENFGSFLLTEVFRKNPSEIDIEKLTKITDPSFFNVISKYVPKIEIQRDDRGDVELIKVNEFDTLIEIMKLLRKPEVQKAIKEGI